MVMATTNCPWDLDVAALRRFEKRVYIPLPDQLSREAHLKMCLKELKEVEESEEIVSFMSEKTEGFSHADIVVIMREAAMAPMRRLLATYSMADLQRLRDSGEIVARAKVSSQCFRWHCQCVNE